MRYLLDTNVISETRKPVPSPVVVARLTSIDAAEQFVSVISVGELSRGIGLLPGGQRRRELEIWFEQAERNFADQLLPVNRDIAHLWGDLTARAAKGTEKVTSTFSREAKNAMRAQPLARRKRWMSPFPNPNITAPGLEVMRGQEIDSDAYISVYDNLFSDLSPEQDKKIDHFKIIKDVEDRVIMILEGRGGALAF